MFWMEWNLVCLASLESARAERKIGGALYHALLRLAPMLGLSNPDEPHAANSRINAIQVWLLLLCCLRV